MEKLKMSRCVWLEPQQEALEFFSFWTCMFKQDPRQQWTFDKAQHNLFKC